MSHLAVGNKKNPARNCPGFLVKYPVVLCVEMLKQYLEQRSLVWSPQTQLETVLMSSWKTKWFCCHKRRWKMSQHLFNNIKWFHA